MNAWTKGRLRFVILMTDTWRVKSCIIIICETCYLFQRISVLIQRFNATLLHESFADENRSDD